MKITYLLISSEREAIGFAGTILARPLPTHLFDAASAPSSPPLSTQPRVRSAVVSMVADILSEIRSLAIVVESAAQAVELIIGLTLGTGNRFLLLFPFSDWRFYTAQKPIGTLRRGTSHEPTPETATPLPDVIDRGLRANISETNRYGRLFREYAVHYNSDINVTWSRLRLMVTHRGTEVYSCPAHPHNVKNAYCLFRLLDNNIDRFVFYLREHEDQVPNVFASATPENYSGVNLDDNDDDDDEV